MRHEHMEQVERWAEFVRNNPGKWKKIHSEFINSIFQKHEQFRERILKTPHGKDKLAKLYNIKNKEGYNWLK